MRKIRTFAVIAFFALNSQFVAAQVKYPTNKIEMIGVCTKFMETFKNEKFSEAFDLLKPYSVIEDYKLDTLAKTAKDQMASLSSSYGKIISYEELSEKDIKGSLVQIIYLLKFQQAFLKFTFILYNNDSGWTITNFKYNDEIDDLFTPAPNSSN